MVHTEDGRIVPVPDDQLPLTLPDVEGLDLTPKGTSPLGGATEWMTTIDPETGEPALRDPDTMDTFVDSSWYFLRFLAPNDADRGLLDRARRTSGRPSTRTSAASSTPSCTCCTRASSPRCCSTWASSTSPSPSRA